MNDISVLEVKLYNHPIGTITLLPDDRSIFAFHQSYIDDRDRETLSLSFKDGHGQLITDLRSTGPTLLPFFSNLLPEGDLRRYLAERAGIKQVRELHLLWALGQDLPGAVTVSSAANDPWPSGILHDGRDDTTSGRENALRFSLAGVQLKFSALKNEGRHGGLTIPAKGVGGSWIVKLPAARFDNVPENEFSIMTIARRLGIDVPAIDLVRLADIAGLPEGLGTLGGKNALAVQRFDRNEHGLVHIEDFAQVFGVYPQAKYEKASYRNIANVLGAETSQDDIAEFIRRLVFCALVGNDDMHLKNWSLIYRDRRSASLSPAYDLLSTIVYLPSKTAALKYARTNIMAEAGLAEFAYLADKARLPEKLVIDTARQTVSDFVEIWAAEKTNLALTNDAIDIIDKHLSTLALVREA